MAITCFIQYKLDPRKQTQFVEYTQRWGQVIPACGANLIGYLAHTRAAARLPTAFTRSRILPPTSDTVPNCEPIRLVRKTMISPNERAFCWGKSEFSCAIS